jgi:hypothetical protein
MHNVTFDERLSSEAQGLKEQALDTRQCPLMIQSGHFNLYRLPSRKSSTSKNG